MRHLYNISDKQNFPEAATTRLLVTSVLHHSIYTCISARIMVGLKILRFVSRISLWFFPRFLMCARKDTHCKFDVLSGTRNSITYDSVFGRHSVYIRC